MKSYVDVLRNEATDLFDIKWKKITNNASSDTLYNGFKYDDLENAFTHAYVSAMLSLKFGENITLNLGYLKEILTKQAEIDNFGSIENAFLDTNRDLWNNQKGIEYAIEAKRNGDSSEELVEDIINNIMSENSNFIIDYKNDNRRWDTNTNSGNLWNTIGKSFISNMGLNLISSNLPSIYETFLQASTTQPVWRDPLLIDLDGDGIETTSVQDGVFFDHQNDGFAESSAWVAKDDGVLAFDKNNNGLIDNGSEIFGDNYIKSDGTLANNGFDALADLDSNNDGVIDANDDNFSMIKILKGDGSILSLEDAGIQSIGLNYSQQNSTDANGNTLVHSGSFTKNDGTNGQIGDFILQYDKLNSVATEWVDVPDDVAILPDAAGSGEVYSLHQAMAKDATGELKNLVNAFLDATDNMQKLGIVKNIILKWTGADTISSDSRGEFIDARELTALEKFMGQGFSGIAEQGSSESTFPNSQAANVLNAAFSALVEHVYAQLVSQTSMKFLYDMINFEVDINSSAAMLDLTDVTEYLKTQILQDKSNGDNLLAEFNRTFINLGLKNYGNYNDFYESFVSMDASYEVLFSVSEKTVIYGTEDNDSISTNAADDAIFGGDGDDYMVSASENSIGNVTTYIYNLGDGNDTIKCRVNTDILSFGEGITKDNINLNSDAQTLQISFDNSDEIITVNDALDGRGARLNRINFADGTFWEFQDIEQILASSQNAANNTSDYPLSNNDINHLIQDMSAFTADSGMEFTSADDSKNNNDLMTLVANS